MPRSTRSRYPDPLRSKPLPPVGEGSKPGRGADDQDWSPPPHSVTHLYGKVPVEIELNPGHYGRDDVERIADRLAMNVRDRRYVRVSPRVAKLCEDGLRMLLSEPSRERLMTVLCGRLNCPDKDNCDPCADKAREIVRMYQDERRKDWSL